MFKPLALFIGLRYTRAKKKNHFVSFISLSSMLGIGMGVMVLITVLSVMNGFDMEIHRRFFGMTPEVTISSQNESLANWQSLSDKVQKMHPKILAIAPFVNAQGLLTFDGQAVPVMLAGIDPKKEEAITHLQDKLLLGDASKIDHFGILLGRGLAENLGVMLGDRVTVMIPDASVTPAGMVPRFKRFTVQGVFSAGSGFNFDTKLAFIDLADAQILMRMGADVSGIHLKINDVYQATALSSVLKQQLGQDYRVENWTESFGAFFQAVKMEKTMMFLILLLIIAVAAFNLVSSLVMVVNDKQAEIAIMRTMGATPGLVLSVFIVQGMFLGCLGTFLGVVSGCVLAMNTTTIVNALQSLFGVHILSSSIYWVDYLPSKILWTDVLFVCVVAVLMSFIATLYPAWRASKTVIAEALHYE